MRHFWQKIASENSLSDIGLFIAFLHILHAYEHVHCILCGGVAQRSDGSGGYPPPSLPSSLLRSVAQIQMVVSRRTTMRNALEIDGNVLMNEGGQ